MTRAIVSGFVYFAMVFGAGFVLGPIRILLLEPRLGARWAELVETPVMLAVVWFAARAVVRSAGLGPAIGPRMGMGGTALALMLAAEFAVVLPLRGLSIADYLAARDPVSGAVYYASLVFMAILPAFVARADAGVR